MMEVMITDLQSIGNRVREVRKSLHMTQSEFGQELGINQPVVLNIELARLKAIPMTTIKLICSKFNVDYLWLTTGQGEMFHQSVDSLQDKVNDLLEGENETARAVFAAFTEFSEQDWQTVQKFMDTYNAQKEQKKDGAD